MDLSNILASIGIGLLASTSPCVFPLYPGYLAYLSASGGKTETKKKNQYFLGFFVFFEKEDLKWRNSITKRFIWKMGEVFLR